MRELKFGPDDTLLFRDLYVCFQVGEQATVAGAQQMRTAIHVYDKLDAIAEKDDQDHQHLQPGGGAVLLENAEFALVERCILALLGDEQGQRPQATQQIRRFLDARRSVRLLDFLRDAPKDAARPVEMKDEAHGRVVFDEQQAARQERGPSRNLIRKEGRSS